MHVLFSIPNITLSENGIVLTHLAIYEIINYSAAI